MSGIGSPLPSRHNASRRGSVQLPLPRGTSMHQFNEEALPMPMPMPNDTEDHFERGSDGGSPSGELPGFFADDYDDELLDANLSGNGSPLPRARMSKASMLCRVGGLLAFSSTVKHLLYQPSYHIRLTRLCPP